MGQQFYSAHAVWYFGHQTLQAFFGALHHNQKVTLICWCYLRAYVEKNAQIRVNSLSLDSRSLHRNSRH